MLGTNFYRKEAAICKKMSAVHVIINGKIAMENFNFHGRKM